MNKKSQKNLTEYTYMFTKRKWHKCYTCAQKWAYVWIMLVQKSNLNFMRCLTNIAEKCYLYSNEIVICINLLIDAVNTIGSIN